MLSYGKSMLSHARTETIIDIKVKNIIKLTFFICKSSIPSLMVGRAGLEPATSRSEVERSIQLKLTAVNLFYPKCFVYAVYRIINEKKII